jgi:DnaK suppressor protein
LAVFDERDYERASALAQGEIDHALEQHRQQMRDGGAGSPDGGCLECGLPIPAARLAAWPTASRCVECQADHERQQKKTGA